MKRSESRVVGVKYSNTARFLLFWSPKTVFFLNHVCNKQRYTTEPFWVVCSLPTHESSNALWRSKELIILSFNAFQHSKITSWLRAVHTYFLIASYTLSLLQVYFEPATLLNRARCNIGNFVPYSFRQVCGFFNVPQNFRVEGIVRRDLRLIVLIREDLKV